MEQSTEEIEPDSKEYNPKEKVAVSQLLVADSHKEVLRQIMDMTPKMFVTAQDADERDVMSWIVDIKAELSILKTSDSEEEIFRAFHQIRHLSTQALLAHVRRDLDDAAQAA